MITLEKISIYKKYRGWDDGYYIKNRSKTENVISGEEWSQIGGFIQDIYVVRMNLAANEFINSLNSRLNEFCENNQTIDELKKLELFLTNKK